MASSCCSASASWASSPQRLPEGKREEVWTTTPSGSTLANGRTLPADLVILAIGVMPEVGLAREAGLTIGPSGGIAVDAQMRTSDPAIFAVGDAVEVTHFVAKSKVRIPLAGPANRQARIAANTIANIPSSYKETQGTSIIQVFDLVCAATGASQSVLRAANIPFQTVRVHGGSHAGYYPGASTVHLTVLFSPEDGRLLGAQACGKDGVDKRIDVLATGLRHGATVYDLEDYELAYAPPFGSAKDPINMVGFVAVNALRGTAPLVDPADIDGEVERGAILLDVRNASERAAGKIEPSIAHSGERPSSEDRRVPQGQADRCLLCRGPAWLHRPADSEAARLRRAKPKRRIYELPACEGWGPAPHVGTGRSGCRRPLVRR